MRSLRDAVDEGTALECEAQWMMPPDLPRDAAKVWRGLVGFADCWYLEGTETVVASEIDLRRELEAAASPFTGGEVCHLRLTTHAARSLVTVVTHRDGRVPLWLPCVLRIQLLPSREEEEAGLRLLRACSRDVAPAWACVGGPDVVVSSGYGEGIVGLPSVGWANYLSADEYDLEGLEGPFAGLPVDVARVAGGAIVWVAGVRWDLDNFRALEGLDAIVRLWQQRFRVARSGKAFIERCEGGGA